MARPYPSHSGRSRDGFHQRPSGANNPPFNHSRRSWIDNGVHYTMETATYASPGLSFSAAGGSASGLFGAFAGPDSRSSRHAFGGFGAGLLGTAAGLLGAMSDLHHAARPRSLHHVDRERHVRFDEYDEQSGGEDDLAYGEEAGFAGTRSRSVFSRMKEKLNDSRQRARRAPYSPETSPARRPRSGRQPSYQEAHDEPTDPYFDDVREEAYDKRHQSTRPSRTESDNEDMLSVLRRTVEHCQTQVKRSRKDLERASRQQTVDIGFLQALLDQVRARERALATAEQDLRADEDRLGRASNQGQQHHHRRLPRRHRAPPTPPDDDDEAFAALRFGRLPGHAGPVDPLFADFDDLHGADPFAYAFGSFSSPFGSFAGSSQFGDDINQLFGMPSGPQFAGPRSKRPRFSSANSGPRPQAHPGFAAFTPAPPTGPPPTSMLPEEAKRLFRTYNDRWNALLPTDPNIPYPARGLQACALLDPNTIWAPMVISPPATWSEEAIMQANAQAFYLCVVDLIPQYTEAGGKVSMGYNRTGATPAQVKQLVDLLKKEKTRWHSDRLGRRNNGMPGPNEALQGDPRARAVFHGVCELMEIAQ